MSRLVGAKKKDSRAPPGNLHFNYNIAISNQELIMRNKFLLAGCFAHELTVHVNPHILEYGSILIEYFKVAAVLYVEALGRNIGVLACAHAAA